MSITAGSTARADDFINKAQANAVPATDVGRVPKLESTGKLHKFFLETSRKYDVFEAMDGTSTPMPAALSPDQSIVKSDNNGSGRTNFLGFMKTNQASVDPNVLGSAVAGGAASVSFTANAGNDRVIVIIARAGDNSSSAVLPTTFVWNGITFTSVVSVTSNANCKMQIWTAPIGNSGSNQTFNITCTVGSGANGWGYHAVCLDKVNQTTPASASGAFVNAAGNGSGAITAVQIYGKLVIGAYSRIGTANISAPASVTDLIAGGAQELSWITHDGASVTITGGSGSSENTCAGIILKGVNTTQAEVEFDGIVSGFAGLTIGTKYYVSDTVGTITTTITTLPIGIAISATEILITRT